MRIKTIKISGFKPFPFCAEYIEEDENGNPNIIWNDDAIKVSFATDIPMQNAIIGPNSCGKSSILIALKHFFSSISKMPATFFNEKATEFPIIIEITFWGYVENLDDWHQLYCKNITNDGYYEFTVAKCWTTEGKETLNKLANGEGYVSKRTDKVRDSLFPEFRLISADQKLVDEANLDKNGSLINDLIKELIEDVRSQQEESLIYQVQEKIIELNNLISRENPEFSDSWGQIEELESLLSKGLVHLTPGEPNIVFDYANSIPNIENVFMGGKIKISDGVELEFSEHGLGVQRSYIVSVLNAWSEKIGKKEDNVDYVFGIEDPELHLHPHIVRVFLQVFETLSERDQIIFTSHSTEFVNRVPISNVISIRRIGNKRSINQPEIELLAERDKEKFQRYLREDRSDMLFSRAVLLVEGQTELYAIPSMARTIGRDLDERGISVVFVNGEANFKIYHQILEAFQIPHVILGDGDGNKENKIDRYREFVDEVYVLDQDFEYLISEKIGNDRFLEIVNECRDRVGKDPLIELNLEYSAENLKSNWWKSLKTDVKYDILPEHRERFNDDLEQIQTILATIAGQVVHNDYYLPDGELKRKSFILKKEGKPLAGRVVGEILTSEEVNLLDEIVKAIETTIKLTTT